MKRIDEILKPELLKEGFFQKRKGLWMKRVNDKYFLKSRCGHCGIFLEASSNGLLKQYEIRCNRCSCKMEIKF